MDNHEFNELKILVTSTDIGSNINEITGFLNKQRSPINLFELLLNSWKSCVLIAIQLRKESGLRLMNELLFPAQSFTKVQSSRNESQNNDVLNIYKRRKGQIYFSKFFIFFSQKRQWQVISFACYRYRSIDYRFPKWCNTTDTICERTNNTNVVTLKWWITSMPSYQ